MAAFDAYRIACADGGVSGLAAGSDVTADDFLPNSEPNLLDSSAPHLANELEREALAAIVERQPGGLSRRYSWTPHCVQRVYGDWAIALEMLEDAARLHGDALKWSERERCPVEAGLCLRGLAEVAERRGRREQALEHLERAGELFSLHGAKLYLDQVVAKRGELTG